MSFLKNDENDENDENTQDHLIFKDQYSFL